MYRALFLLALVAPSLCRPYDPEDDGLESVLPSDGTFEAFYPREAHGIPNGSSRPSHGHGSFYKHRNPALVDVKNAAAYGFRFDEEKERIHADVVMNMSRFDTSVRHIHSLLLMGGADRSATLLFKPIPYSRKIHVKTL